MAFLEDPKTFVVALSYEDEFGKPVKIVALFRQNLLFLSGHSRARIEITCGLRSARSSEIIGGARWQVLGRKGWEPVNVVVKDYVKSHTPHGLRRSVHQAAKELLTHFRHRSAVRKARRSLQGLPLKLNLGCGPNNKPGWLNIDLFHSGADLQLDLRERWPFPDGSVAYIYSEHVFEHFEFYREVPHVLSESLRVLQTEGVFDVGVPDTEWPLRGYGNPGHDYWLFAPTCHPNSCETQLDHINYHFRQGEQHKYAWDEETLTRSLQRGGVVSIARRPFDATLDSESRSTGTLYMRAIKPPTVALPDRAAVLR